MSDMEGAMSDMELVKWNGQEVTPERLEILQIATEAGADLATLETLCNAVRVSLTDRIVLPSHRYETLSRGRGWCRQGMGDEAIWGKRVENGYRVGPGRWVVGATDGFRRQDRTPWDVKHIQVGGKAWTIAD